MVNNYKRTPYRNLLYDSVLQLVLAWNKTIRYHRIHRPYARYNDFYSKTQKTQNRLCDITLEGKGDQVDFEESDECIFLDVAFTKHHNAFVIGYYDFSNKSISLNHSILLPIPPDRFKYTYITLPLNVFVNLLIWVLLVYALVTINFCLLLIFRKEHEVKASSVPLSMCIL